MLSSFSVIYEDLLPLCAHHIVHYSISLIDDWECGSQKYIAVIMINIFGATHRNGTFIELPMPKPLKIGVFSHFWASSTESVEWTHDFSFDWN